MRVGVLLFVVLAVAVVANAQPTPVSGVERIEEIVDVQLESHEQLKDISNNKFNLIRQQHEGWITGDIFLQNLPQEARAKASSDQVLMDFYKRVKDKYITKSSTRYVIRPAKWMLCEQIAIGVDNHRDSLHGIANEQVWKKIVFDAIYTVESHLLNFIFVNKGDILWSYAMAHHALKVGSELAQDFNNAKLRYDLFPSAAIKALLPRNYLDIPKADAVQDNLLNVLYNQAPEYEEARRILARRFAKAYADLKKKHEQPQYVLDVVPKDVALRWLQVAAKNNYSMRDFTQAYNKAPNVGLQPASSSAAEPAMVLEQQPYYAVSDGPPHFPQAGPYLQYGHPPFHVDFAASSSSAHPSLYSNPHPPDANPEEGENDLNFPDMPHHDTHPQEQDFLSQFGGTATAGSQQRDFAQNRRRTRLALHEKDLLSGIGSTNAAGPQQQGFARNRRRTRLAAPHGQDLLSGLGNTNAAGPQQQDFAGNRHGTSPDAPHVQDFLSHFDEA